MNSLQFFEQFLVDVMQTPNWGVMEKTVENSPWHREANVAVHTLMTIDVYLKKFAADRSPRQQLLTLIALTFHDFGKPEAEEVKEKKDAPGEMYRTYAGHEPKSANEFMSFMCDNPELRDRLFAQGLDWKDLRSIKVMIEHHLPYGLKVEQKRENLKEMLLRTLGDDEICFYDMLRSDSEGRISDNHEEKLANVDRWIKDFCWLQFKPGSAAARRLSSVRSAKVRPTLLVFVGVSGAGKSTWIKSRGEFADDFTIVSEDDWRIEYAQDHMNEVDLECWPLLSAQERYDLCWKFCHLDPASQYDKFARDRYDQIVKSGKDIILDRMNQTRKGRSSWISRAKDQGYEVISFEFPISEKMAIARQATRGDKRLPDYRVHQICMQMETPWLGPEVDGFEIIPPT